MGNRNLINISVLIIVLGFIVLIDVTFLNLILSFLVIIAFVLSKYNSYLTNFFSNNESIIRLLTISMTYAFVLQLLNFYILAPIIERFTNVPIDFGVFENVRSNLKFLVFSICIGWVVGGLLEETIFRGYLIRTVENLMPKKGGLVLAILGSSFFFGYLHGYQGISGQILTGSAGLILAVIYILHKRNLWLNIFTHGFMNSFGMLLVYFDIV